MKPRWSAHLATLAVLAAIAVPIVLYDLSQPRSGADSSINFAGILAMVVSAWFAVHALVSSLWVRWKGASTSHILAIHAATLVALPVAIGAFAATRAALRAHLNQEWQSEAPSLLQITRWTLDDRAARFTGVTSIDGSCKLSFRAWKENRPVAIGALAANLTAGPATIEVPLLSPPSGEPDEHELEVVCERFLRNRIKLRFLDRPAAPVRADAIVGADTNTYNAPLPGPAQCDIAVGSNRSHEPMPPTPVQPLPPHPDSSADADSGRDAEEVGTAFDEPELRGRVLIEQRLLSEDKPTLAPRAGVAVVILRNRKPLAQTVTDANGAFVMRIPSGRYVLEASAGGHWPGHPQTQDRFRVSVLLDVVGPQTLVPDLHVALPARPGFSTGLWIGASAFFGSRKTSNPSISLPVTSPPAAAPAVAVAVREEKSGREVARGQTDGDGFFAVAVEAGEYLAEVAGNSQRVIVKSGEITLVEALSNLGAR